MDKLYKILVDEKSCHGGTLKWSLPQQGKPGAWHSVEGPLSMCKTGMHLTMAPYQWYSWGCTSYIAEAREVEEWQEDKCCCRSARLIEEAPHPQWWLDAIGFVGSLNDMKWLDNHGDIDPKWKMFPTWDAARYAAWDAARYAAWNAARNAGLDAARNAGLKASFIVCSDLNIAEQHGTFIDEVWRIYTSGYGYFGTVDGIHYVYEKP